MRCFRPVSPCNATAVSLVVVAVAVAAAVASASLSLSNFDTSDCSGAATTTERLATGGSCRATQLGGPSGLAIRANVTCNAAQATVDIFDLDDVNCSRLLVRSSIALDRCVPSGAAASQRATCAAAAWVTGGIVRILVVWAMLILVAMALPAPP
jgi:hypothetical protein